MRKRKANAGAGNLFDFHGAFLKKADAVAKERSTPGAFIKTVYPVGRPTRHLVLTKRAANSKQRTAKINPDFAPFLQFLGKRTAEKKGEHITARQQRRAKTRIFSRPLSFDKKRGGSKHRAKSSGDSAVVRDVAEMLRGLGYGKASEKLARDARGETVDERFRDVMRSAKPNPKKRRQPKKKRTERSVQRTAKRRRRSNPDASLAASRKMYRDFHGKEARPGAQKIDPTLFATPQDLAKLGDLVELFTLSDDGEYVGRFQFSERPPGVYSTPDGKQIYFVGGNQNIDAAIPRWATRTGADLVDLGLCYHIRYFTRKAMDKFLPALYCHGFAEEGRRVQEVNGVPTPYDDYQPGELPRLIYDRVTKKMALAGGIYRAKPEGIVN